MLVDGEVRSSPVEFRHRWDAEGVVTSMRHHGLRAWVEATGAERALDAVLIRLALRVMERRRVPRVLRDLAVNFASAHALKGLIG